MPVLKKKITLPIRRNTSLFIDVEAGVTGLGGVAKGLRSRLGKRPELKGVAARLRNGGVQTPRRPRANPRAREASSRPAFVLGVERGKIPPCSSSRGWANPVPPG